MEFDNGRTLVHRYNILSTDRLILIIFDSFYELPVWFCSISFLLLLLIVE